jgi:uncharacterized protein DUF6886
MDSAPTLHHVSEERNIAVFDPRSSALAPDAGPIVWAIDGPKLPNYLLPRDCPRVSFGSCSTTRPRLFLYELPPQSFRFSMTVLGIGCHRTA